MAAINRKHKDRLFSFLFGNSQHKDWTLSLYNAVNGSSYTNPDDIQITTINAVIYMGMKNDVSFIVSDMLNIFEQQSTFNPNMPIRMLMYAGKLYDKYIHMHKKNIYSSTLVHLPMPKLVVFYNGPEDKDDAVLKLSDSFMDRSCRTAADTNAERHMDYDIEVKVRMANINYGHNKQLMAKCRPLSEYSWLIDRIRKNSAVMGIEDAVDKALGDMPDDFLIKPCLLANKAEVKDMCITEYNEAETFQLLKEESLEIGRREGRKEGRKEGENKLGRLMTLLLSKGLAEDAKKAAEDESARNDMYKKYGIS